MIQFENVSKSFGDRLLFSDASFSVGSGERCAIAGRNGSGKTTFLKMMGGEEPLDSGGIHLPKGCRIGALPQHLHFTEKTVLEEGVLGLPANEKEEVYRVEKILSGLGLSEEQFAASPQSLSGGYQLRLALTKVLVGEPDLLLLDEPTNYLDIVSIRWLERFLSNWKGQIFFISHDRAFVNKVATHIIGIHRGKIKKVEGGLAKYKEMIALEEENYEKTRQKTEKKKAHMQAFIDRFGAKATKAAQARSRVKAIEKLDELEVLQEEQFLNFKFRQAPFPGRMVVTAHDLAFSYSDKEKLIEGLSLEVEKGERIAIIGKNGRGKSTVLRLLSGELQPKNGNVNLRENVRLGYFGQTNIEQLHRKQTVEDEVKSADPLAPFEKVRAACGVMLFTQDDAKKTIEVLSGGERSRVLLAKILMTPANLLLLDEPTHHLDIESVEALLEAVKEFEGSVVLVTHDESVLNAFSPHKIVICTQEGQEVFLGDYPRFIEKKGWDEGEASSQTLKKGKEDRRKRAEFVQERSRLLKPIKRKMEKIEAKIKLEEKKLAEIEKSMQTATADEMKALAFDHGKITAEIDKEYEELEKLLIEEEKILEGNEF